MAVKRQFQPVTLVILLMLCVLTGYAAVTGFVQEKKTEYRENQAALKPLPDLHFYDAGGKKIMLSDFRGGVVLVNLWATWCPPCVAELAALDALQAKLKGEGLTVIALSADADIAAAEKFFAENDIAHLAVYHDTDRQAPRKWSYAGLPVSFLLDREGRVLEKFEGPYAWDAGEIFERVRAALR